MTMRTTLGRFLGGTVAVALLGLAVPTQAVADDSGETQSRLSHTTAPADGEGTTLARRTARNITLSGREVRRNKFVVRGRVGPTYDRRPVIVERRVGPNGRWKRYNKVRTNSQSRYRSGVAALGRPGKVFYRTKTAATPRYKVSYSNRYIRITTTRG